MNQTESRRKAEGSGVGILGDTRPAASGRNAASALDGPWLQFRAYLTAPDGEGLGVAGVRFNRSGRRCSARNLRGGRNSLSLPGGILAVY
jgi:hypothetical protein